MELAQDLDKHEQTGRKDLKAFLAAEAAAPVSGWDALPDRPRSGRPATLTEAHLLAVERLLDAAAARGEQRDSGRGHPALDGTRSPERPQGRQA